MYELDLARQEHRQRMRDAELYRLQRQLRQRSDRRQWSARLGLLGGALAALGLLGTLASPWPG